jgi:aquaporin related protein
MFHTTTNSTAAADIILMFADASFRSLSTRASSEVLGDFDESNPTSVPLQSLPEHSRPIPATATAPPPMAQPAYTAAGLHPASQPMSPIERTPDELERGLDDPLNNPPGFQGAGAHFGSMRSNSRAGGRPRARSNASQMQGGDYPPRLDFDMDEDDARSQAPLPQRRPSRQQLMRYGPPPPPASEYGYEGPQYYPRPPYDYGRPVHAAGPGLAPEIYYGDEINRPYRRMSSLRESDEWRSQGGGRGPPGPPRRRYRGDYDDHSEDEEEDERPLRSRTRKRQPTVKSTASPPPEIIMRLPFTEWMNRSAKARELS